MAPGGSIHFRDDGNVVEPGISDAVGSAEGDFPKGSRGFPALYTGCLYRKLLSLAGLLAHVHGPLPAFRPPEI